MRIALSSASAAQLPSASISFPRLTPSSAMRQVAIIAYILISPLCKLTVEQLGISAACLQQRFMRPLFDDVSLLHHQDQISVGDGGETMCDDEARPALHEQLHGLVDVT